VDAFPMLFHLQDSLKVVVLDQPQNDEDIPDDESDFSTTSASNETPAVIRIAAHAGVLLIDKYMDLTWDCEIYVISIGTFLIFDFLHLITDIYISYVPRSEAAVAERLCFIRAVERNQKACN
jgi:hypothetical protein